MPVQGRFQDLEFAHKHCERREPDQYKNAAEQARSPYGSRAQRSGHFFHVVRTIGLPEPPCGEERKRFTDRMIQRMEESGEYAQTAEPKSKSDNTDVLD